MLSVQQNKSADQVFVRKTLQQQIPLQRVAHVKKNANMGRPLPVQMLTGY